MIETPQLRETPAQFTAYIPLTIPREEIREVMGPGITEVYSTLDAQGIPPAGAWFTHHQRMDPAVFDFRISVPVTTPVTPAGRVLAGELPAAKVARTVYTGPYEGLGAAWGEFMEWIKENHLTPAEDLWETYVLGPESSPNPEEWRTELYRPLVG